MGLDLNIDLGELDGEPEVLFSLATTVNLACGGHAGDEASMDRAVRRALRAGARVAAHPSYPDRAGFGRASMVIAADALAASVSAQCATLRAVAERAGGRVRALKLHGALYHDAARSPVIAVALLEAARRALGDAITVVGPPLGAIREAALARALPYEREGFADRVYRADGNLVPRAEPGSVLADPPRAVEQALRLARGGGIETLCVHGDNPAAEAVARAVRRALEREGLLGAAASGGVP
jgi:UPF0271 protein